MKFLCDTCRVYGRYVHTGELRPGKCERCGNLGLPMVRPCHKPGQPSKIGPDRVKVQVWLPRATVDRIVADFHGPVAVGVREVVMERYPSDPH